MEPDEIKHVYKTLPLAEQCFSAAKAALYREINLNYNNNNITDLWMNKKIGKNKFCDEK